MRKKFSPDLIHMISNQSLISQHILAGLTIYERPGILKDLECWVKYVLLFIIYLIRKTFLTLKSLAGGFPKLNAWVNFIKLLPLRFSEEDAIPHSPRRISNSTPLRSELKSNEALQLDSPTSTYTKSLRYTVSNFSLDSQMISKKNKKFKWLKPW